MLRFRSIQASQYTTSVVRDINIIEQIHSQFIIGIARLFANYHKPSIQIQEFYYLQEVQIYLV